MNLNLFFNITITSVIFILVLFIIKFFLAINHINKNGKKILINLENKYKIEKAKHIINHQKILLFDDFHSTLPNRLFKVIQELILIQKFIFDKY